MTAQEPAEDDLRVEATPDKSLFISMLTKDIELIPAVLDLVDNSVDAARAAAATAQVNHTQETETTARYDGFTVTIEAGANRFMIADNCGGMDLDIARHYAFRFGRPSEYLGVPGSVGQFGVGLKRAVFKLGTRFQVESRTPNTAFELDVNVPTWSQDDDPDWSFRLDKADRQYQAASRGVGTTITVPSLHPGVSADLSNPLFLSLLREQLRLRHQGAIQNGLEVLLNGERLTGLQPLLLSGPDFSPINRNFVVSDRGGLVAVRLVAGITNFDSEADARKDDGDAEDFRGASEAGWWLFCNDRLLLVADRSRLTGWGDAAAAYHPQYRQFRGYVYLYSDDASLLPWNTTKTGVDQDSRIWRQVQSEMKTALVHVMSAINRVKRERDLEPESPLAALTRAVASARPTPLGALPLSETLTIPPLPRVPAQKRTTLKVQYDLEKEAYRQAADALGVTSAAEVGRRSFEYFYEREIEE